MPSKWQVIWNDPLTNLVKFIFVFAGLVCVLIYFSNASTSHDLEWYKTGFEALPYRILVYQAGKVTTLEAGAPGFAELAEGVRASLAGGVKEQSNTGLSDASLDEARNRYESVEVIYPDPVKLHAWFFTGNPTQMLFPITGRHSEIPIVFLAEAKGYLTNAPILKTNAPLLEALRKLGYIQ
jgi:hypothetical protein